MKEAAEVVHGRDGGLTAKERRARLARLIAQPFAHRGLHGPTLVENSLGAFEAAIVAGHGIELDVQETRDGRACVFHDTELDRLTDATGPVLAMSLSELQGLTLRGSQERITSLEQVLELVSARVPLLVELKTPGHSARRLCKAVHAAIQHYRGPIAVMSYHPGVGRWFRKAVPQMLRGLVVRESGPGAARGDWLRGLAVRWASPDLLAYNVTDLPSAFSARMRANGLAVLAWTCRGEADAAAASEHADQIIYEQVA